ncbi:MAG: DUF4339 domain-containing protein [Bacteroidales bacterium]|nr:DUF4339 domain-containing protein [Bacteroidales bacterium]
MKQYYYSDGQQQIGPISKDELKLKGITKGTLVWCEGLSNWTKAGDVDELADLFPNIPTPPINAQSSNSGEHTVFNTNALLSSIICGGLILFYGILQYYCNLSIVMHFPIILNWSTYIIVFCTCVGIGFLIGNFKRIQDEKIWLKINQWTLIIILIIVSICFVSLFCLFTSPIRFEVFEFLEQL